MTESLNKTRIETFLKDIIEICKKDPMKIEVVSVNFKSLLSVMKHYERAPRLYNHIIEDAESTFNAQMEAQIQPDKRYDGEKVRNPVIMELERVFGRKLKQTDLQHIGTAISNKTGLKLDRETKRSKVLLVKWFTINWRIVQDNLTAINLES